MKIHNPYKRLLILCVVSVLLEIAALFFSICAEKMWLVGINCFFLVVASGNGGYVYFQWRAFTKMVENFFGEIQNMGLDD